MEAKVIIPLAVEGIYTYTVPPELRSQIKLGQRVQVSFGPRRKYTGLVAEINPQGIPTGQKIKSIEQILDQEPLVSLEDLKLWEWMADYYMCPLGSVMLAAIPANLRPGSDTMITRGPGFDPAHGQDEKSRALIDALMHRPNLPYDQIKNIVDSRHPSALLESLSNQGIIEFYEKVSPTPAPAPVPWIRPPKKQRIQDWDALLKRAPAQHLLLQKLWDQPDFPDQGISYTELRKWPEYHSQLIRALLQKSLIERYFPKVPTWHGQGLHSSKHPTHSNISHDLNKEQEAVLEAIMNSAPELPYLIHGVTGSGKTEIYLKIIQDSLRQGQQVLFMVPEIALTQQLAQRVSQAMGFPIRTYHSRITNHQKALLFRELKQGVVPLVLSARSGIFLPFKNLGLIIVDEESDRSYKQQDPAPRYHGRDSAYMKARLNGARLVMGSATPSLESIYAAEQGHIHIRQLNKRYYPAQLPQIELLDLRKEWSRMQGELSRPLIEEIKGTLARDEQVLLFQNRRGYTPIHQCLDCGHRLICPHCDISLNFHRDTTQMHCHYCGHRQAPARHCPQCQGNRLGMKGFGTQKLEDSIKMIFPEAKVARMDLDSTRGKGHESILQKMHAGKIQILIGTQMIAKGLDFERVQLIGVLDADSILFLPHFRAYEEALQLLMQVSGRAGRRHKKGTVLIQTFKPDHPVFAWLKAQDYTGFAEEELALRGAMNYPPSSRMIRIELRHHQLMRVNHAARHLYTLLKPLLGDRLSLPIIPYSEKLNRQVRRQFVVRHTRQESPGKVRSLINKCLQLAQKDADFRSVRVIIDADPLD